MAFISPSISQVRDLLYPSNSVSAWQPVKESSWLIVPESEISRRIVNGDARYALVLNRPDGFTRDGSESAPFVGPAYFDFDAANIGEAIDAVQDFGKKLADTGLDLDQARWYLSGSKGLHCEIPPACFRANPFGFEPTLPLLYKELTYSVFIDTMDLRVYSMRMGRMWRVPNVPRENGQFKVPVSWSEVETLTPEIYMGMTSAPRPYPPIVPPSFTIELALIYERAANKVEKPIQQRKQADEAGAELRKRFKGSLPPSVKVIANGKVASPAGFQQVATQLAIVAVALGMPEETLIQECSGLTSSHASDSNRYNTPAKRIAEIRRMHRYMATSNSYAFSSGAVRSILPAGMRTPDLSGLAGGRKHG